MSQRKIFLSFIQKQPDERIAQELSSNLKSHNFDVTLTTKKLRRPKSKGSEYTSEIQNADVFIALLSERAMVNEMITTEIQIAKHEYDKRGMLIIPVLINLPDNEIINELIENALSQIDFIRWDDNISVEQTMFLILNRINKTQKNNENKVVSDEQNNERNVRQNTIGLPIPNAPLVPPGGNIAYNASYYITRQGEDTFVQDILREGALLRIKGPRQFGKTSLLSKIIHFAREQNHHIVALTFQKFRNDVVNDLDKLLVQISAYTTRKLKLENRVKEYWSDEFLEGKMKCTAYFEEYILEKLDNPLILAIDEADLIFSNSILSSDFFGMLRAWHEERNINPVWNKFKLIVSHSTEAYMAISQLNQSPFNIGIERDLHEFNRSEVNLFAEKLNVTLNENQIDKIMELVGGHPYLVHVALYEIASGHYSFNRFVRNAHKDNGPFSDHLRRHLWNLSSDNEFRETMKRVIAGEKCNDTMIVHKLRAAGLVKGAFPNLQPGFKIYSDYFKDKL